MTIDFKIQCDEKEESKLKLILLFNQTTANFRKGLDNYKILFDEVTSLENELKQTAMINNVKENERIAKEAELKAKKIKKDRWQKAIEELETNFNHLCLELEDNKIKYNSGFYDWGINIFEYVKSIKLIKI